MPKIALIGAGSVVFARRLTIDILSWPELADGTIALMDIDAESLVVMGQLAERIVREQHLPTQIEVTEDRKQALDGADYVITSIDVGGRELRERDVEIPQRYGIYQTVADTIGPGGVFRALRTTPVLLDIAHDMETLCPQALLLNYTNPMNINMWAIGAETDVAAVGLCHSVQGTAGQLARYMGLPSEELAYWVAGINHQAWFLQLNRGTYRGEDLYPLLREKMDDAEVYAQDRVRFEVLRHFAYFVTESSRHMSEYTPWFRRTAELRERFGLPLPSWARKRQTATASDGASANSSEVDGVARAASARSKSVDVPGGDAERRAEHFTEIRGQLQSAEPIPFQRTHEYCSYILHAIESNTPFRFNGNVPNEALIPNLPSGCNVEVPILADSAGLHPCYIGDLPAQCAAINRTNVNVQELAVAALLNRDREAVYRAVALDPLTTTQCSLDEAREMTDELFAASADYLRL
ncbi:MAG: alpha-glucosidase/alpha-galactosidase [Dehalococcoidia bacterium]|nr:alpha-glucosidase/alpha-galactosidase [Dehalococcoidia bacterium]